MADAADEEFKHVELKAMTKEDVELPESIWNAQLANYYGNNPSDILTKIKEDLEAKGQAGLGWLINQQSTPYEHYFFSSVISRMTGVSLCFMAQQSLESNYGIYMFDSSTYKLNPKAAPDGEWKAQIALGGFTAHQWKCEKRVINEETLEETMQMTDQNDNMLFYVMHQYQKANADSLNALKKLKFSFAGNQYKVIKVDTTGDSDCVVSAEGNGECLCACKTKEGILVVNWASTKYAGAGRRKWGSLKGKNVQFYQFIKDLHEEFELITIAGDGYN